MDVKEINKYLQRCSAFTQGCKWDKQVQGKL